MAKIQSHRDLLVWQKGMDLVVAIYAVSKQFPPEERYGLIQQATRAAVAVPANIAEGSLSGILCVRHSMRSVYAPQDQTEGAGRAAGARPI